MRHSISLVMTVLAFLSLCLCLGGAQGPAQSHAAGPAGPRLVEPQAPPGPSWEGHGVVTRISVSSSGEEGNQDSGYPSISGEGNYVTFSSEATNLVGGDENGVQDVFVHHIATGTTVRASVDSSGAEANDRSSLPDIIEEGGRYVVALSLIHI